MTTHDLTVTPQGTHEVLIRRSFRAPRPLVWDAMTKPALLQKWLCGPPGWEWDTCEMSLRVGGTYRWTWKHKDGMDLTIRGVNKVVNPPEMYVRTELMEGACAPPDAQEVVATMLLKESAGGTIMTITVLCPSTEVRDAVLNSGMESGMVPSYEKLDALLASHR